ncbi:SAV_915 family protein [Streptomyces sp. SP18CS02]|uniref:SAV_915 family protein n=1 Tax=Streptomyces sp. SP18CS02 TaxID=3002531 RepID=UPI002E77B8EF|nr:SAV_915 family protein [Streptomyces sp. SP18CS02]MEE1753783.1 hypothetical protein [Streptomyces sp. SP18CS02]
MSELLCAEEPEPSAPAPAGPLYVPVRPGPHGYAVRLFRTPPGGRTAIGFTTEHRLTTALGPHQPWVRLAGPVLRRLVTPLGVTTLTVDPCLSAPSAVPLARGDGEGPCPRPGRAPAAVPVGEPAAAPTALSTRTG